MRATALLSLLLLASCGPAPAPPPMTDAPEAGIPATYTGARICSTCHVKIAATYRLSGMGRSFGPMNDAALASFDDVIEVPDQELRYALFEKDGRFYQKQFQLDSRGRETHVDVREMVYVLGSGNHSRSFVTVHDGRLYQMPVCWYPEAGVWDLCPGYETVNRHFERGIDETCLFCHNARVTPDGAFGNRFTGPIPHGIDCERCHGPGSLHVARWSSAAPGTGGPDRTIIHPGRLPPALAIQVCMQCHLGDAGQTDRVMRGRGTAALRAYRPGRPLQSFLSVHTYEAPDPARFGLGAQADRLALSRCYQRSAGRLLCVTCHDPHQEVYDLRRTAPGRFDDACRACHGPGGSSGRPLPADHGAMRGCPGCHMRRAEPHDQRYTTFTDHWIRSRPADGPAAPRTDFAMRWFFEDQAAYETPRERPFHLGRALFHKKTGSSDGAGMPWELPVAALERSLGIEEGADARFHLGVIETSRGRLDLAEGHFRRALQLEPNDGRTLMRLGSVVLQLGDADQAARILSTALARGVPGDDEGTVLNDLARAEMLRGRLPAARGWLDRALAVEPLGAQMHANLGLLARAEGDTGGAVASWRRALTLDPSLLEAQKHLAGALAAEGPHRDLPEAIFIARRAVRLAPGDAGARETLDAVCRAAGRALCDPDHPAGAPAIAAASGRSSR